MIKKKELSEKKRGIIVELYKAGKSNRQIATELNIPRQTVDYNVKKFITKGTITNNPRQGRPKATTSAEDINIIIQSKRNRRFTAPEITTRVNESRNNPVSVSTVKRQLLNAGLKECVAVLKPLLKVINKKKKLYWAQQKLDSGRLEQCSLE